MKKKRETSGRRKMAVAGGVADGGWGLWTSVDRHCGQWLLNRRPAVDGRGASVDGGRGGWHCWWRWPVMAGAAEREKDAGRERDRREEKDREREVQGLWLLVADRGETQKKKRRGRGKRSEEEEEGESAVAWASSRLLSARSGLPVGELSAMA